MARTIWGIATANVFFLVFSSSVFGGLFDFRPLESHECFHNCESMDGPSAVFSADVLFLERVDDVSGSYLFNSVTFAPLLDLDDLIRGAEPGLGFRSADFRRSGRTHRRPAGDNPWRIGLCCRAAFVIGFGHAD